MNTLKNLIEFLNKLEERKIYYRLNKIRDSILVEVTVPGQKWEVEFMADGTIEIENLLVTVKLKMKVNLKSCLEISQINQLEYIQYFLIIETSPA